MELLKEIGNLPFEEVRQRLTSAPYKLNIRESKAHPQLYSITYDLIKSDFKLPLVSECRGIILEKDTNRLICWPFNKFWNHGEGKAAKIDWNSAKVQEKYDGSLMKLYHYDGEWIVATNSVVDSNEAFIFKNFTFYDMFLACWRATIGMDGEEAIKFDGLDEECVYMFEAMHSAVATVVGVNTKLKLKLRHFLYDFGENRPA
jgi:hypothetical protein